jgi:hypothetical protein
MKRHQPSPVRDTTRNLVEAITLDVWPRDGAIVDFGLKSQEHYEALYYPVREGEISPEALDAALGDGEKLTALARSARSNPHKDIAFRTDWDDLRPEPETPAPLPADPAEPGGVAAARQAGGTRYIGCRTEDGVRVLKEGEDGRAVPLPMRNDLRDHSPDGAEWGYSGSGSAQLALAILSDALGEGPALDHYQDFKRAVIGGFDGDRWELGIEVVRAWYGQNRRRDAEEGPERSASPADLSERAGAPSAKPAGGHDRKPKP